MLILAFACSAYAQEIKLGTHCLVFFATVEAARHTLTNRDDFISALSPFDRAARMKTNYIIHPDEILAVNFVHLINGETNLATPRIVEEMKKVFRQR